MARELHASDPSLPAPTQRLSEEESVVTVPDGDLGDPTDLDTDYEEWDFEVDGPLPEYPDDRVIAELNQAITTKDE